MTPRKKSDSIDRVLLYVQENYVALCCPRETVSANAQVMMSVECLSRSEARVLLSMKDQQRIEVVQALMDAGHLPTCADAPWTSFSWPLSPSVCASSLTSPAR